jgi:hypothetical protein
MLDSLKVAGAGGNLCRTARLGCAKLSGFADFWQFAEKLSQAAALPVSLR